MERSVNPSPYSSRALRALPGEEKGRTGVEVTHGPRFSQERAQGPIASASSAAIAEIQPRALHAASRDFDGLRVKGLMPSR